VRIFLKAEWRHLAMFNYAIDPALLAPLVPYGTELDFHDGQTYVSIVAFLFLHTRVLGIPIPFHCNFEEVNLRFYIRRREADRVKRAVSFIQEMVPRRAIAFLANTLYNERYGTAHMSHRIENSPGRIDVRFDWSVSGQHHRIAATARGEPRPLVAGSLDRFIAEHYWGYAAQRDGSSIEYAVTHPSWLIRPVSDFQLDIDFASLYGHAFVKTLSKPPESVFLAEGSAVTISHPRRIRPSEQE
jgi:uncharacterized protein YqjF (DUF2071 family)